MPIQASSILKNTGPKQDLKYWIWGNIPSTNLGGSTIVHHPNLKDVIISKWGSFTSRIAEDGRIVWTRNDPALSYSVVTDSSGNIYTSGGSTTIVKYNLAGSVIWARSVNTGGVSPSPNARIVVGEISGAIYCASAYADTVNSATVFKLNSDGSFAWARRITGVNSQFDHVAADEPNNRVYVSGYAQTGTGGYDATLVALDLNGTVQWQKKFGVPEIDYAFPTGLHVYDNKVLIAFRMGFNGPCPIFKYTRDGALSTFSGLLGLWGADDFFGGAFFDIDKTNGNLIIGYISGTIRKYTFEGGAILGRRFVSSRNVTSSDVDINGDMYFLVNRSGAGTAYAKVKGDGSGTGSYGFLEYNSSPTSSHYPDNSMQAWEDPSSYSIAPITLTSTAISHSGVTGNPTGLFVPLRTK